MLKVTIELFSANDGRHEILHEAIIYNDATGTHEKGNYVGILSRKGGLTATRGNQWKAVEVEDFPRLRKNSWHLLKQILDKAIK